jgi:hypothetical protein
MPATRLPHFTPHQISPLKKRCPKKKRVIVESVTRNAQKEALFRQLQALRGHSQSTNAAPDASGEEVEGEDGWVDLDERDGGDSGGDFGHAMDVDAVPPVLGPEPPHVEPELPRKTKPSRRIVPNKEAYELYSNWHTLLPTLHDAYLFYLNRTFGRPNIPQVLWERCEELDCTAKTCKIVCLYLDRKF